MGGPSTRETETPYPHGTNTQSVNPSGDRARKGHRKHSITQDDTAHLGQIRTNNFQSTIAPVPSCGVPEDTGASELVRTRLSHSLADIKPEVQRWSEVRQRHVFHVLPHSQGQHGLGDVLHVEYILRPGDHLHRSVVKLDVIKRRYGEGTEDEPTGPTLARRRHQSATQCLWASGSSSPRPQTNRQKRCRQ